MNISDIIGWLFSSREGVFVLLGVGLLGFLIAALALERKTRKDYDRYDDDENNDESGWSLFDDDNK